MKPERESNEWHKFEENDWEEVEMEDGRRGVIIGCLGNFWVIDLGDELVWGKRDEKIFSGKIVDDEQS